MRRWSLPPSAAVLGTRQTRRDSSHRCGAACVTAVLRCSTPSGKHIGGGMHGVRLGGQGRRGGPPVLARCSEPLNYMRHPPHGQGSHAAAIAAATHASVAQPGAHAQNNATPVRPPPGQPGAQRHPRSHASRSTPTPTPARRGVAVLWVRRRVREGPRPWRGPVRPGRGVTDHLGPQRV